VVKDEEYFPHAGMWKILVPLVPMLSFGIHTLLFNIIAVCITKWNLVTRKNIITIV